MYRVHGLRNIAWLLAATVIFAGCVTTGSRQMETVVTDMHQRVTTLDQDLQTTITSLNEKTAALIARVNENERQVRLLHSMMEENQRKIDRLLSMLQELKKVLYRHWGLAMPAAPTPAPSRGVVRIEPPAPALTSDEIEPAVSTGPPASAPRASEPGDSEAYAAAKALYDAENYGQAQAGFSAFLSEFPRSSFRDKAQFWIGKCFLSQSEYSKAIEAFEVVRSEYPESSYMAFALHNQAVAHYQLGEKQTAVALMEEVVSNFPTTTAAEDARRDLKLLQGR
jgi:tol-pal system protein YbgF